MGTSIVGVLVLGHRFFRSGSWMRFLVLLALLVGGSSVVGQHVADSPAVRVTVSGVCGSGTICGADSSAGYVMTNAHVVGTSVGRGVSIDIVSGGQRKTVPGRIVWSAYSGQRMIDAAIVSVPGLSSLTYRRMSTVRPSVVDHATVGSPRCVWPLVLKPFLNPDIRTDGPLMLGDPNAIGGQSGSSIYDATGTMFGLVTWSWGGRCAGQQTASLYSVASSGSVRDVDDRPVGLVEVNFQEPRSLTEDGVFGIVAFDPKDLPIWDLPSVVPPGPCVQLSEQEFAIIQLIRARSGDEKSVDWAALIKLILELIALFRK